MPSQDFSQINLGRIIHQWEIPETAQYQRGRAWYVVMGLIALALIAYALLTANFLFALLILLLAAVIFMSHSRAPLTVKVAITEEGIWLNKKFYRYPDLRAFWIVEEPPLVKSLYLDFQSSVRPSLSVYLDTQEPAIIRETLSKFIAEDGAKKEEPFSDLIWRMLKL